MAATRPALCLAAALAAFPAMVPLAAAAQDKPTLLDYFSPDRIAARVIQMGILSLRTQADIVYGSISTSALTGSATLTDVKIWPIVDWETDANCYIAFDRIRLATVPLDDLDHMRFAIQASGGTASLDCLPPEPRGMVAQFGVDTLSVPRAGLDFDYTISSSAATVQAHVLAEGLAALTLSIDMDYLAFDGRKDIEEPEPVVFLNSARLTVENLGLWQLVLPMLPPQVTDSGQAGTMIDMVMSQMDGFAETPSEQRAPLAASAKAAWADFLVKPETLVLETSFEDGPRYLDLMEWDRSGPDRMLDDLEPRVVTKAAPLRSLLPAALVAKAYDTPDALTDDERVQIGTALATGTGAPRDLAQAEAVLTPAAEAGSGEAALALALALESRDPAAAYTQALRAAEAGADGAAGTLDRIERALPFAQVLELQHALVEGVEHPVEALSSLSGIRDEATKRMSGHGRGRSYEIAALWATLGKAAGDAECAAILDEIDEMVRHAGPEALEIWKAQEAASAQLAHAAWTGFDLPAAFGGN